MYNTISLKINVYYLSIARTAIIIRINTAYQWIQLVAFITKKPVSTILSEKRPHTDFDFLNVGCYLPRAQGEFCSHAINGGVVVPGKDLIGFELQH